MGVVSWACGGRRSGRVRGGLVFVWVWLVMAGVWCLCSHNLIRVTTTFTTLSPERGKEKRNVMDDNDDEKVMSRRNKEGESENDGAPRRTKNGHIREGEYAITYHGRQKIHEAFPKNYDLNMNGHIRNAYNDDDDATENDNREMAATNEDGKQKTFIGKEHNNKIKEVEGSRRKERGKNNHDIKLENYIGEDNNEKIGEGKQKGDQKIPGKRSYEANKEDENEDEENKREKGLFVTELQPDPDKPADSPKIEEEDTHGGGLPWDPPLSFNGNYGLNETLNGRPVVKVVLLAYQRSGSTFTGELLASGGSALFTFEPLYPWRRRLSPAADPALLRDAARLLGDILDCHPEVIQLCQKKEFYFFRKKPAHVKDFCKDASLRILKTIRARASFMLPWLIQRQDVKVIHLVRDPRGILNSVKRGGQIWSDKNRDIALQCASIKGDLSLETIGPQRYLRVRYEDLIDKQMEVTTRMFSFLGVPLTYSVKEFVKEHIRQDPDPTPVPQRYLNTYRDSKYRHDHWRNELDRLEVQHIQAVCQDVMNLLQYPFLSPS